MIDGVDIPADRIVTVDEPIAIRASLGGATGSTKFIGGAAGRSHLLLVGSDGHVYGFGNNVVGQLGMVSRRPTYPPSPGAGLNRPVNSVHSLRVTDPQTPRAEVTALTRITGPWSKEADTHIVQVTAGHTFSLFLTNTGVVYATGSSECGQLGNAKTGERLLKGGKSGFDIEVPPRE